MQERIQEDLDLRADVAPCRACGSRRVVCTHGTCTACHHARRRDGPGIAWDMPVHLCCGWWGWLEVLPWQCLTCGAVRTLRRA